MIIIYPLSFLSLSKRTSDHVLILSLLKLPYIYSLQSVLFLYIYQAIASEKNVSLGQLVVAWTIAQPGISVALVGARNRKQVEENAVSADIDLTTDEINLITKHLDQLELVL